MIPAGAGAPLLAAHGVPALRATPRERFAPPRIEGDDAAQGDRPAEPGERSALDDDRAAIEVPEGVEGIHAAAVADPSVIRFAEGRGAPTPLRDHHAAIVAQCLDTIAMCARHRATRRLDERASEEQRVLDLVDALVVCPGFPSHVLGWWRSVLDLPDPWKVWAPTFLLACLEGDDLPEALAWVLGSLDEGDTAAVAIAAEALALGPSPEAPRWGRALLCDERPALRAIGVEALALGGALAPEEVIAALSPEGPAVVRWAALRACARLPDDPRLDALALEELGRGEDAELLWEAARALARRGQPDAYEALRIDPGLARRLGPRALDVLALLGDAGDAPLARQVAARCGLTSAVLRGLARYGHPGAAPALLRALGDEDAAEDAATALEWIFGAPLDPDDRASPGRWREWLRAAPLDDEVRLRFGRPYRPGCAGEAIAGGQISRRDLEWLLDEASVRAGVPTRPAPWRWSPDADASVAPAAAALAARDGAFSADAWRAAARPTEGRR